MSHLDELKFNFGAAACAVLMSLCACLKICLSVHAYTTDGQR